MTIVNFEFSQQELDSRIALAHSDYEFAAPEFGRLTALELFLPDNIAHSLELYYEKRKAGYMPAEVAPVLYQYNPVSGALPWIQFYLYKPEKQQTKDKAEIAAKVEATYRQELESLFNAHVEQEARRTVERRQRELEAERIAKEAAELEAARQEIIDLYKGAA
ncbi:hypothetical protein ACFPU0_13230 [Pseudomonas sp. GCM10022186]|uniref:hypothetical protein n=1 Tax=Pseudomonas sp. GCM10022186 TaxID=3252650 RepID=UPI00360DEFFB